ncbi:MAG TPA: hypothetical protein VFW11_07225 [Cyclobacteriaceae bacterium]|nr:hypothetical protein [Cyclobacteriaceae bacterium]
MKKKSWMAKTTCAIRQGIRYSKGIFQYEFALTMQICTTYLEKLSGNKIKSRAIYGGDISQATQMES